MLEGSYCATFANFFDQLITATEEPLGALFLPAQRIPAKPMLWLPSHSVGWFLRPFPPGRRCHLLRSLPAEALPPAVFPQLAAGLRSAWRVVRTSPAYAAGPHGCPSYNPLGANVSLGRGRVNTNPPWADYGGNPSSDAVEPKGLVSQACSGTRELSRNAGPELGLIGYRAAGMDGGVRFRSGIVERKRPHQPRRSPSAALQSVDLDASPR